MTRQEAGRQGGRRTLALHGVEHFRAIGRKGFAATCNRHFAGDRRAMLNDLIRRGLMAQDPCPWNGHRQDYTAFPEPPSTEGIPQ
jgi:general stress protein YciG